MPFKCPGIRPDIIDNPVHIFAKRICEKYQKEYASYFFGEQGIKINCSNVNSERGNIFANSKFAPEGSKLFWFSPRVHF